VIRLGTRGSALALAQARWVAARVGDEAELVEIATAGDLARDRPASAAPDRLRRGAAASDPGDKSRWTGALERALLAEEIDVAVHSAKDVPIELAEGTVVVAVPEREDARDVLVGADSLDALPAGARVGTSALRRRAQLLALRPDLEIVEIRGNVDTRLRKLAAGEVDALVLAAAGLARLGREDVAGTALPFTPAPGQGCLLLQAREGATLDELDDAAARDALLAERAVAAALGASCHTALGVHAAGGRVRAWTGLPDGSEWLADEAGDPAALAERMLAAGAAGLLARAEAMAP
jgi:hydroxymethylbilane synthase